jgi:hypothetical protein
VIREGLPDESAKSASKLANDFDLAELEQSTMQLSPKHSKLYIGIN